MYIQAVDFYREDYLSKMFDRFPDNEEMKKVYRHCEDYIRKACCLVI